MVIAMPIVLMMQMPIDKIVNVITVWYRFMTATRSVNVSSFVPSANMPSRTIIWIGFGYLQRMLLNHTFTGLVMQMTVVQKVDMVPMLDCCMAAFGSMNMAVVVVCMAHWFVPSLKLSC